MKKKKILITGAYGRLAKYLIPLLVKKYLLFKIPKEKKGKKINLSIKKKVFKILDKVEPDYIINLAAFTDVSKCESNIIKAYESNYLIVKNICNWIKIKKKGFLIQLSTDHLYDSNKPSKENDISIKNVYALTKYLGEIEASGIASTILRVNFISRSDLKKNTLSDWVIKSIKKKKKIYLYKDVYFSPLYALNLAKIILKIIPLKIIGTFNLGAKNGISKSNFVKRFVKKLNLKLINYEIISYKGKFLKVLRPKDMRMNVTKFEKKFKIPLPKINHEIDCLVNEYKKNMLIKNG